MQSLTLYRRQTLGAKHTTFSIPHSAYNCEVIKNLPLDSIRMVASINDDVKKYMVFKQTYNHYLNQELTEVVGANIPQGPLLTIDDALAYLMLDTTEHKQFFIKSFK